MCAADEAIFVNAMNGTSRSAFATACAQRIINDSEVVFNLYSARGANLFTFFAADTAVCAIFASQCALIVIGALNDNL